jgi:hypothetical protein
VLPPLSPFRAHSSFLISKMAVDEMRPPFEKVDNLCRHREVYLRALTQLTAHHRRCRALRPPPRHTPRSTANPYHCSRGVARSRYQTTCNTIRHTSDPSIPPCRPPTRLKSSLDPQVSGNKLATGRRWQEAYQHRLERGCGS